LTRHFYLEEGAKQKIEKIVLEPSYDLEPKWLEPGIMRMPFVLPPPQGRNDVSR
jgi:hypothetical protein